jgi:septum formation protein
MAGERRGDVADLILASASFSRQMLLRAAQVPFRVSAADINEDALMADLRAQDVDAEGIALALAEQKAVMVSRRSPDAWVLGGDSVLAFGAELVSKCRDIAALRVLLKRLRGQSHELISAACLARNGAPLWRHAGHAHLTMRAFSDDFLDAYLAAEGETVLSCVGGYRYEGPGAQLFEHVEGDYFTVLGLPLLPVLAVLRAQGILIS